ncbi:MAG: hypothetical protein ACP5D7_19000 [Limnospira sp.]
MIEHNTLNFSEQKTVHEALARYQNKRNQFFFIRISSHNIDALKYTIEEMNHSEFDVYYDFEGGYRDAVNEFNDDKNWVEKADIEEYPSIKFYHRDMEVFWEIFFKTTRNQIEPSNCSINLVLLNHNVVARGKNIYEVQTGIKLQLERILGRTVEAQLPSGSSHIKEWKGKKIDFILKVTKGEISIVIKLEKNGFYEEVFEDKFSAGNHSVRYPKKPQDDFPQERRFRVTIKSDDFDSEYFCSGNIQVYN